MSYLKTQTKLNKLFTETPEDKRKTSNHIAVMDGASVCMVEGKTPEGDTIIRPFTDIDREIKPFKLDDLQKAKYSLSYLKHIIDTIYCMDYETITIEMKKDYPIIISNKDIKFILAPRVDN